ncbi:MAG: reverse transcriptase domain-containing protein [Thermodesulfobacteriota bacterium]
MATSTTTIRTTTTTCGAFATESDHGDLAAFRCLHAAYLACRKRKRGTVNALRFEVDVLENLRSLGEELASGSYRPSRSVCFVTTAPKLREIFAADFRDRVVHHLLVPRLEAIFEPKFIHDSYANRQGKGTHAAVRRLSEFMNRLTGGGRRPGWFLQLDIKSFFMSIDRDILFAILRRHVTSTVLLDLARTILDADCTTNYLVKGDAALLAQVPPGKSLFHLAPGKGLPIGNLTSQFFANVYLNELDQFIKHELKCRFYLRYVDDFILLHESPETLISMRRRIAAFLADRLALSLKAAPPVCRRVSDGADFLGYIVRPAYRLVRNRVVGNLKSRLRDFKRRLVVEGAIGRDRYTILHPRPERVSGLRQVLASYLGHFRHADSFRLVRSLWERHPWLAELFTVDNQGRLHPCYEPTAPKSLAEQYGWALRRFPGHCLFFQVGRFVEFFGEQTERAAALFGLKARPQGRPGLGPCCGFPLARLRACKKEALRRRLSYAVIAEHGRATKRLKRRVLTEKVTFAHAPSVALAA